MFTLIELPYALDALEPVISAQTLSFHHGKHLQGYVDNLNKLIAGTELEGRSLEEIIVISSEAKGGVEKSIFNNAGQILNHNLYFTQFKTPGQAGGDGTSSADLTSPSFAGLTGESPSPSVIPGLTGNLLAQIEKQWGALDAFKTEFESKGVGLFGSGWVWLQADDKGNLSIAQYSNADNPVAHGLRPLLTFDVWEHAYYLDYQNRRAAHLQALWQIVNWEVIETRYIA